MRKSRFTDEQILRMKRKPAPKANAAPRASSPRGKRKAANAAGDNASDQPAGSKAKKAKENSDDETSRGKDGDFVTLRANDNVPDAVRTAVFALQKGDVSEPVRQQAGYYLLKADDITYRPLSQVRDEIFQEIKQQHYGQWMDKINRDTKVTLTSPEFLGATPLPVTGK